MAFLLACMHQKFKLFLAWERYPLPPLLSSSAISTCSVPQLAALTRFLQLMAFGIVPNLTLLKASLQSKSFHLSRPKCVTYNTYLSILEKFYHKTWHLYLTPSNEVWNEVGQSGMALNSMDAELWGDTILVVKGANLFHGTCKVSAESSALLEAADQLNSGNMLHWILQTLHIYVIMCSENVTSHLCQRKGWGDDRHRLDKLEWHSLPITELWLEMKT